MISELINEALTKAFECYQLGNFPYAEEIYRQILRITPDNLDALQMCSLTACQNGRSDEAKELAVKALALSPSHTTYNNLGLIHGLLNESSQAIDCFKTAIKKKPDESFLYTNLALEVKKTDVEAAIKICEESLCHNEHFYFNYASIVHEAGMYSRAIDLYKQAISINENMAVSHYNLSACYFLLGDYKNGWEEYEWRWKQFPQFVRNYTAPYWDGSSLKGKKILLYCEQGLGDTIMFCRFIKFIHGAHVILEVNNSLFNLMKSVEGIDELSVNYTGEMDCHCSLLSLPRLLDCPLESPSYLSVPDVKSENKVGICWAGSPLHPNDKNRSISVKHFKSLNYNLYSLQKDYRPHYYPGVGIADYSAGREGIIDMSEKMIDFYETGKIIKSMDFVITVDTSVAHLAGALGVKTYLLLPKNPDWRWMASGSSTHWYDNTTLVRNQSGWKDVFIELGNMLC